MEDVANLLDKLIREGNIEEISKYIFYKEIEIEKRVKIIWLKRKQKKQLRT
ncbi:MAG: hypothetical protein HGN29_08495 [Asgard group archaeon]|nr:hypothetical protein [Asgard group archaeon]